VPNWPDVQNHFFNEKIPLKNRASRNANYQLNLDPFTFEMEFDDLSKEVLKKLIFDETDKFFINRNRMGPALIEG
jgi:hypothetical protein